MSEWKEVKLGDIIDLVIDYRGKTPKKLGGDWSSSGYRALSAKNIKTGQIVQKESIRYVDESLYKRWMQEEVKRGDILITSEAPFGQIYLWDSDEKIVLSQRLFDVRIRKEHNSTFVYYQMQTRNFQSELDGRTTGTTVVGLRQPELLKCHITIPDINTQNQISGILSSLDAKIETNNKLNEKLEEMAQAIFKSWFVDFEPFKDKPFHETEIGYIPQIFESGVLGDLCTFKRGKGLLSKDAILGNVPVIAGGMKPACYHNIANTKAPVVTVSGSGANAGYTQIHNVDVWASDCSFIDSNCENLYYVYCFLSRRPKLLRHSQTGAAQPHVKPADIHRFQVVIPTKDVINEFQQIVKPLFDRIGMNKKENDRLASLRDTLLPRLMSGELIV